VKEAHVGARLGLLAAILGIVLLAIQLVPVERSNPPVEGEMPAPPEVREVLRRACYDCHSNETVWPWYSHVAPVSWLLAHDVSEGRRELNYSRWSSYSPKRQAKLRKETWKEVDEREMPPWYYLPMHPAARLGEADRVLLRDFALSAP
jgi:Haem-binding domain